MFSLGTKVVNLQNVGLNDNEMLRYHHYLHCRFPFHLVLKTLIATFVTMSITNCQIAEHDSFRNTSGLECEGGREAIVQLIKKDRNNTVFLHSTNAIKSAVFVFIGMRVFQYAVGAFVTIRNQTFTAVYCYH